jgi:serine phosphatase RsbU (regulator of sigma subunit)
LCTSQGSAYLQPEVGPPLGVEGLTGATRRWPDTGGWPVWTTQLEPGSSLLLYTDGLLDAYRIPASRDSLGVDELLEATSAALASGEAVSTWIPTIVGSAPQRSADDTAVVVLTVHGPR